MKTFSTWLEMTVPPHHEEPWEAWSSWYTSVEPTILHDSLEELNRTGNLTIRGMEKRAGVSEGLASFLVREFLKKHKTGEHDKVSYQLRQKDDEAKHAAGRDEYLYHVTTRRRLPLIKKNGLSPSAVPQFSNYVAHSQGKVFFCEKAGVNFWKQRVEQHESHNHDRPSRVIVLRVKRSLLEDKIQNDGIGSDDSGSESYYITDRVPPRAIEVV